MRFRSWTLLTWAHLRLSWERRTLLSWDLSILERRNMACLFSGLDGACTCWIFFSGRGCSVARRVTFRETFPSSCLFTISVFTHIVRILLRTVVLGQGVQWIFAAASIRFGAFSLGLQFGSLRIRHLHCLFWAFTHLGSSLSVKGFLCFGSALSLFTSLTASLILLQSSAG